MNLTEIDKKLQNEFALAKLKAETEANKNLEKANNLTSFRDLTKLERETIFALGKEMANDSKDKKNVKTLSDTLSEIATLKEQVLNKIGLTSSDLIPNYNCKKCKDTGIVFGRVCECYTKRRNREIIKEYRLDDINLFSFNDINTNLFSTKSQLDEFNRLKSILEKWCLNYPKIKKYNFVLRGDSGLGKTFLIKCMAKTLLERNFSVCFVSAFEMNSMMLKYHTAFNAEKESHLIPLLESEILFIDDLGTEPIINNVTINYLYNVLSEREERHLPTIITTNLNDELLSQRYGDRIFSRLHNKLIGNFILVEGKDLRHANVLPKK